MLRPLASEKKLDFPVAQPAAASASSQAARQRRWRLDIGSRPRGGEGPRSGRNDHIGRDGEEAFAIPG